MTIKTTLQTFFLLIITPVLFAQTQLGSTIYGASNGSYFGYALSMGDAITIAVGSPQDSGGVVRVYSLVSNSWQQKGADIRSATGGWFGSAVSMPNANTVAINCGMGDCARIFTWNGTAWQQKGAVINVEVERENGCISMPDSNTVAFGHPSGSPTGGATNVYEWVGSAWQQKGLTINGEFTNDQSGWSVSMPDANTLAIGAPNNPGLGPVGGHTRIFEWISNAWVQKGTDIDGSDTREKAGYAVSMPDASTIGIGYAAHIGSSDGMVKIYEWISNAWVQKGADITDSVNVNLGHAVSMPNANTIAIGANRANAGKGKVMIFEWLSNAWVQKGQSVYGDENNDQFGLSVSMPDTNTFAGGAHYGADSMLTSWGFAKIFGFGSPLNSMELSLEEKQLNIYPNPTSDYFYIDIDAPEKVIVLNSIGTQVLSSKSAKINLSSLSAGLYFIKVFKEDKTYFGQVLKK